MKEDLFALVIDDEHQVSGFVAQVLESDGWNVSQAGSAEQAFGLLFAQKWLLVFCDVMLGGTNGYDVLRQFVRQRPDARFVLMTGQGSAAGALDATAFGAYDYLLKPFGVDQILNISQAVHEQQKIRSKNEFELSADASPAYTSDIPLIGKSPNFVECLKMVGRVADTNLPVLISGESGTGKEVVAQAIHRRSRRASNEFIAVNCGAIPVELIESELFGHVRGSFTGAERERVGLWEKADGGTILLDEITETSRFFQVKLLRALQQGEIRRVGSNESKKVDVRVIAATNRDVEREVREGNFRQDLMYRLNAVTIHLPALRERVEDIPLLADYFARRVSFKNKPVKFSRAALDVFKEYDWQGNIRELENAVLHAVSLCEDVIYPEHLPLKMRNYNEQTSTAAPAETACAEGKKRLTLAEIETEYALRILDETGGNKQAAARILNIDRKTLIRIISRTASN